MLLPAGQTLCDPTRFDDEAPRHPVWLPAFGIDRTEVTVAAYRACVDSGKCTVPQLRDINSNYRSEYHRDDHPVNMVNFAQATNYCATRGQALPSEAQFEWAAGHGDGRKYPWGNQDPTCENELADFTPGTLAH